MTFDYGTKLYGPTLFSHFLGYFVNDIASKMSRGIPVDYTVILILTDGAIHDMKETTEIIVRASELPISIIIIGIGNSHELEKMEVLDSDS